jgi:hypothetical protein
MPDIMPATFKKVDLRNLHDTNSVSLKNRFIDKEVNKIKYKVLEQNNLGYKNYVYEYQYVFDGVVSNNDYFNDLLNKLVVVFPDSVIKYTTDISSSSDIKIYNNSSMTSSSSRPTYSNHEKKNANNTITIDWS